MASQVHRTLLWNVNSFRTRFTDLHSYVISRKPDLIAQQEVGPQMPKLKGYVPYSLIREDGSSRGLTTYVRQTVPATFHEIGVIEGIEFIYVYVHKPCDPIYFINVYVHYGSFRADNLPDYVLAEHFVLLGDINARCTDLGSHITSNVNGVRWKAFLDAADNAFLTGDAIPSHVQGGRLDYVVLFNLSNCNAKTVLLPYLLSDHFAVYQQRWQCNPSDRDARDCMVSVALYLTELRLLTRRQY